MWLGQGMQRHAVGGNAFRACAMLPAATGNFGRPGRPGLRADYLNLVQPRPRAARPTTTWWRRTCGECRGPASATWELAPRLEDPARVQALVCWNINPGAL